MFYPTRCNNQQKCTVDVSNNLFGDPCPYVPKYLEVNYTCVAIHEGKNYKKQSKLISVFTNNTSYIRGSSTSNM